MTTEDLRAIRNIVSSEISAQLAPIEKWLTSLDATMVSSEGYAQDVVAAVKDIQMMLARMQARNHV